MQVIGELVEGVYAHWMDYWNTVMEPEPHQDIADWRHGIIHAALSMTEAGDRQDDTD
jgi:hypothetical protein